MDFLCRVNPALGTPGEIHVTTGKKNYVLSTRFPSNFSEQQAAPVRDCAVAKNSNADRISALCFTACPRTGVLTNFARGLSPQRRWASFIPSNTQDCSKLGTTMGWKWFSRICERQHQVGPDQNGHNLPSRRLEHWRHH